MSRNNHFLIISQSGRALAASAKRAGIDTHVIDLFADEDTYEDTLSNHSVTGFSGGNNAEALIGIVAEYTSNNPDLNIVIGSGFEECPELLAELEQRFSVIGNHSSVVRQVKDPSVFFNMLEKFALPFPEFFTDKDKPEVLKGNFLIKKTGGAGGGHIKLYQEGNALTSAFYLQALLRGKNYSTTFIADGESFYVLGHNETWNRNKNGDFTFAGAVSNIYLSDELCQQITDAIGQLVPSFNLKGLCSLDFIVEETGQYSILEVNPRPTATFELYDTQESLFAEHLAAFNGKMRKPESDPALSKGQSRALEVLYAGKSITIPRTEWPDWVTDRPKPGKLIASGEPICTMRAAANSAGKNKALLKQRETMLKKLLGLEKIAA
jgi:predicted ATP-grasp superfamily ATP-dependent carboligase